MVFSPPLFYIYLNSILLPRPALKPLLKFLVLFPPEPIRKLNRREKDKNRRRQESKELFKVGAEQERDYVRQLGPVPRLSWLCALLGWGGAGRRGGQRGIGVH